MRSRVEGNKRIARSKQLEPLVPAVDWLGDEAKPYAVGWSSYDGRTRKRRGTARAGRDAAVDQTEASFNHRK
jgi:hypothetical protein